MAYKKKKRPYGKKNKTDREFTRQYWRKMGHMKTLNKGVIKNFEGGVKLRWISWDAIDLCIRETCMCAEICEHDPTGVVKRGFYDKLENRCIVQYDAIKEMERCLLDSIPADIDQVLLFRIGTELVPLYKQWAKLNMYEIGSSVMATGAKGSLVPHPIMKELRAVIHEIGITWKGLDFRRGGRKLRKPGEPVGEEMFELDGVNYYELMEAGEMEGLTSKGGDRILRRISNEDTADQDRDVTEES